MILNLTLVLIIVEPSYFSGSGYKLGETSDDHQFIAGQEKAEENSEVHIALRLWKDGFTIGDGPLRSYHGPENKEFLQAVAKGEIPQVNSTIGIIC